VLNVMLFEMRAERNSCARNITLDWITDIEEDQTGVTRKLLNC